MSAVALPPGIYVPIPTFFHAEPADEQPIDTETIARHIKYLCSAGVHGIVSMGSTGEAVHLTNEERVTVLRATRKAIDESGTKAKLIAGCSKESVRETVQIIEQAAEAGAEYALVLPPSYFVAPAGNRAEIIASFYQKVADRSPIPVIIYNYPGVTQQMDTPEETLVKLATHPNIVGMKCTDGNVGKAAYVCENTDRKTFTLMSGAADTFVPFLTVGAQGCVPGFGNVAPRTIVHLFNLYTSNAKENWSEIQRIQGKLAGPDHALFRWNGISGVKAAMQKLVGYGGLARAPLLPTSEEQLNKLLEALQGALEIENQLSSK